MAIAQVGSEWGAIGSGGGANSLALPSHTVTTGSVLVVAAQAAVSSTGTAPTANTPSKTAGTATISAWALQTTQTDTPGNMRAEFWTCTVTSGGTLTITITPTASSGIIASAWEFSGVSSATAASSKDANGGTTALSTGSGASTTVGNELLIAFGGMKLGTASISGAAFSPATTLNTGTARSLTGSFNNTLQVFWEITGSATSAVSWSGTANTGTNWIAAILCFTPSGGVSESSSLQVGWEQPGNLSGSQTYAGTLSATQPWAALIGVYQQVSSSAPAQVTGVAIPAVGSTSALVNWNTPADNGATLTSYDLKVFLNGVLQTTITGITVADYSALSGSPYGLTGLTAATGVYTLEVRANNGSGNGAYSAASAGFTTVAASGTIAQVGSEWGNNTTAASASLALPTHSVTAGHTILVAATGRTPATLVTPTDDGVNSYVLIVSTVNGAGTIATSLWAATALASGPLNILLTPTGGNSGMVGSAWEFSGIAPMSDQVASAHSSTNNASLSVGPTSSTTVGGELIMAVAAGSGGTTTWSAQTFTPSTTPTNGTTWTATTATCNEEVSWEIQGASASTAKFTATQSQVVAWNGLVATFAPGGLAGPPSQPDAPEVVVGDQEADVTIAPPADNGSPISSYTWNVYNPDTTLAFTATQPVAFGTTYSFFGLTDGITYGFTVIATNGASPFNSLESAITYDTPMAAGLTLAIFATLPPGWAIEPLTSSTWLLSFAVEIVPVIAPSFGFSLTPGTVPTTWYAGSWVTDVVDGVTIYVAQLTVGVGENFVPVPGVTYYAWIAAPDVTTIPNPSPLGSFVAA